MKGDNLLVMPQNDDRTVEGVMERLTVRIDLSEKNLEGYCPQEVSVLSIFVGWGCGCGAIAPGRSCRRSSATWGVSTSSTSTTIGDAERPSPAEARIINFNC